MSLFVVVCCLFDKIMKDIIREDDEGKVGARQGLGLGVWGSWLSTVQGSGP